MVRENSHYQILFPRNTVQFKTQQENLYNMRIDSTILHY